MTLTVDQFGKALVASGLMTADELKALWNAIPADARPKQGDGFAKLLVQQGKLNQFQADELLSGRNTPLAMGDYVLTAKIGEGGMGQVFKAQHKRMNRTVALKVMSAAAMKDENAVKRFQREVHAAARLEHPNIVTAYDSGEVGNVKYLVMQFVDGGDLSSLVKKSGPLEIERAVDYVVQAARGLSFAHGEGVIHRDIKPANLLLDKKGVVKILDMGLARIENGEEGLTATEQVMGTVDYMSPEQAANTKTADGRSDIYSLGCTLWYLLTAKKVYDGDTMISRLMSHRTDPLPSLVKTRDDVPWALEQTLHKMIAKTPQERFQTMDEVVAALASFGPSGSTTGGMGSSIGMGPQNAELASFLKSVGPAVKPQTKPAPTGTKVDVEATAQFVAPEASTDPKSEILPLHAVSRDAPRSAKPQTLDQRSNKPPVKLLAGAIGGFALLAALGVWVLIKDKDGNEVVRVQVPEGGTATVVTAPPAAAPKATVTTPSAESLTLAALLDSPDYVWTEPENLGQTINGPENDVLTGLTNDELRLYFRSTDSTGTNRDFEAFRSSSTEPFGKATPSPPMTTDAYVSGDGLSYVAIARPDIKRGHDLVISHRPTLDAVWSKPVDLGPAVSTANDERRPTLSHDGLTLLFDRDRGQGLNGRDLWISRRTSLGAPFGPPQNVGPAGTKTLMLADDKTMVYRRTGMLHYSFVGANGARASLPLRNHPFGDEPSDNLELWLTPDGRTAYFSAERPGGLGKKDIYVTRRVPKSSLLPSGEGGRRPDEGSAASASATSPHPGPLPAGEGAKLTFAELLLSPDYEWTAPENLGPTINGPGDEVDPSLTGDQQRLFYRRKNDPAGEHVEAVRTKATAPFGPPTASSTSGNKPYLSGDGLSLVYTGGAGGVSDVFMVRRPSLDGKWGNATDLGRQVNGPGDERNPTLSPDGLMLLFRSDRTPEMKTDLWISGRTSQDQSFGPAVRVAPPINTKEDETYGLVLADNRSLLFRRKSAWYVSSASPTGVQTVTPLPPDPNGRGFQSAAADVWLSPDGRTAYFSANLPGGLGGYDIWTTRRVPKGAAIADLKSPISDSKSEVVYLDDIKGIDWKNGHGYLGKHGVDKDNKPFSWLGAQPQHALFTHPSPRGSAMALYALDGKYDEFQTTIGLVEKPHQSALTFRVRGDDKVLWESSPQSVPQQGTDVRVSVRNVNVLTLEINCPGDSNSAHAVWIAPRLTPVAPGGSSGGAAANIDYLDDLTEVASSVGYRDLMKHGLTIGDKDGPSVPIFFRGQSVAHSLMMHPPRSGSAFAAYQLDGKYDAFTAEAGLPDNLGLKPDSSVVFRILGDGRELWKSGQITNRSQGEAISVSVRGVKELRLEATVVGNNGNCHATWFMPRLTPLIQPAAGVVYLDDLPETAFESKGRLGKQGRDRDDKDLNWLGQKPSHSLFTHPVGVNQPAWVTYALDGRYAEFRTTVGATRIPESPLVFSIFGDDKRLWESKPHATAQVAEEATVDVRGVKVLSLEARSINGVGGAHAVWIDPRLTPISNPPAQASNPQSAAVVYLDDLSEARWAGRGDLGKHGRKSKIDGGGLIDWFLYYPKHSLFGTPGESGTAVIEYDLAAGYQRFETTVGLLGEPGSPHTFRVWGDDKKLWESPPLNSPNTRNTLVSVDVNGVKRLKLELTTGGKGGPGFPVWIDPRLTPIEVPTATPGGAAGAQIERLTSPDYEWTEPEALGPEINLGAFNTSPYVSPDGLSLWFSVNKGTKAKEEGQGSDDLWVAHRASAAAPWEPAVSVGPPINHSGIDSNASISADGLYLLFWRHPAFSFYESKRATTTAPWSEPIGLQDQLGANVGDPCLSPDGLELFYMYADKIHRSTRPDRNAPWGKPKELSALSGGLRAGPIRVSPDGRSMMGYWLKTRAPNTYEYWLAQRSTATELWSTPQRIELPKSLVDISELYPVPTSTGLEMYFHRDRKIHVTHLVPKAGSSQAANRGRINVPAGTAAPPPAVFPFDAATAQKHQEAWAAHLGVPVEFTNAVGMKFRLIPPGEFQMGLGAEFTDAEVQRLTGKTDDRELQKFNSCRGAHLVRITRPFYMEVEEVTIGRFQEVVGELRPGMTDGPDKPLQHYVTWPDAIAFCNKLSEREGKRPAYRIEGAQITPIDDADGYRLPTEAQWEYACRAGTNTLWYFGNDGSAKRDAFKTQSAAPNPFGLLGLYGGANEWCWDAGHNNFDPYPAAAPGGHVDPREDVGTMRIKRGGSGSDNSGANRITVNSFARQKGSAAPYGPDTSQYTGFGRVVLPIPDRPRAAAASSSAAPTPAAPPRATDLPPSSESDR